MSCAAVRFRSFRLKTQMPSDEKEERQSSKSILLPSALCGHVYCSISSYKWSFPHAAYATILAKITEMGYSQDDNNHEMYLWPANVPLTYFSNHSVSQSVWLKLRSAPEKRVCEIYIKLDIAWSLFLNLLRCYLTPVSVHLYLTFVLTVYFIHCSWLHKKK